MILKITKPLPGVLHDLQVGEQVEATPSVHVKGAMNVRTIHRPVQVEVLAVPREFLGDGK